MHSVSPYKEKMQSETELNFNFYFSALFLPSLGSLLLSIPLKAMYAHFSGKSFKSAFVILQNVHKLHLKYAQFSIYAGFSK